MAASLKKSFTALLEPDGTALKWTIARVPFDIAGAWPRRVGLRVRGEIAGFAFRTSLFPDPRGAGHILLVNKKMLAGARARLGDKIRIFLEPDLEEPPVETPPELAAAMRGAGELRRWAEKLSPSMRREIYKWVTEPKSPASREKRAEKLAERMLAALEGETEPPPVLKAIFQRRPEARIAWEALTATQRRNHLLGIFYYESPEAKERRAARAIEDALARARKRQETS